MALFVPYIINWKSVYIKWQKQSIPLTKQVEYYTLVYERLVQVMGLAAAEQHLSKSIFPVVIGSNDLFGYFKSGSDVSKKSTPQQYVDSMVAAVNLVLKVNATTHCYTKFSL